MEPKVSIILPVYNGQQYLAECLDSILAQTMEAFELLCVNDGSTDGTRAILLDYQRRDPRIRILDQENGGYGRAMNRGIREAIGAYIAVVESDDCICADMLAALYSAAEESGADVVKADFTSFTGAGEERRFTYMQTLPDRRLYGVVLDSTKTTALFYAVQMTWEGIYRRSFLLEHQIWHNPSPGASFQDNGFWFQVFAWAERVYFLNRALYQYRVDNTAASTRQGDLDKLGRMFGEYDFILAFLNQNPAMKDRLYPTYLHFRFNNLLSRFFCASEDCRREVALLIQAELRGVLTDPAFSWALFGGALCRCLKSLLDDPSAFAAHPPRSINDICWSEAAGRPTAAEIDPNASIPAAMIAEYHRGLPDCRVRTSIPAAQVV